MFLKWLFRKETPTEPVVEMKNYIDSKGRINWKDNPELRHNMFKLLIKKTDKFILGKTSQTGSPEGMTSKEMDEVLKQITVEIGLPEDKWKAVGNQIAWACTSQNLANKSLISAYTHNKSAAMLAGYMTLKDTVTLYTLGNNN